MDVWMDKGRTMKMRISPRLFFQMYYHVYETKGQSYKTNFKSRGMGMVQWHTFTLVLHHSYCLEAV